MDQRNKKNNNNKRLHNSKIKIKHVRVRRGAKYDKALLNRNQLAFHYMFRIHDKCHHIVVSADESINYLINR